MFKRGIRNQFVDSMKRWNHWGKIAGDPDLFVGIRNDYVNIYYHGCSILKISFDKGELAFKTHYKYLVRPSSENPYVFWKGDDIPADPKRILMDSFDKDSLKKSSAPYAEAEKVGLHSILRSNRNIIDVEIAISPEAEDAAEVGDHSPKERRVADRIDFAAIRNQDGKPCIAFFEAKRFDNGDLRSPKAKPAVIEQIDGYENFIKTHLAEIEASYRTVCKNLVALNLDRLDPLVKRVADSPGELTVDSNVWLVVFGYDNDQKNGDEWKKRRVPLDGRFGKRLLLKGTSSEFTSGISK